MILLAYLLVPTILAFVPPRRREPHPAAVLLAALWFWLPLEFDLLPRIEVEGRSVTLIVSAVYAILLFTVIRPFGGIGFTFRISGRNVRTAAIALVVYAVAAIPIGLATGFLRWNPAPVGPETIATPLLIYVVTALPEEFLFRGLLQNVFMRWWGRAAGLTLAAVVFGLAHFPDVRYIVLAAIAGVAYGWVYQRTGKVTVSAITHALVNTIWAGLLRSSYQFNSSKFKVQSSKLRSWRSYRCFSAFGRFQR